MVVPLLDYQRPDTHLLLMVILQSTCRTIILALSYLPLYRVFPACQHPMDQNLKNTCHFHRRGDFSRFVQEFEILGMIPFAWGSCFTYACRFFAAKNDSPFCV